MRLRFRSSAMLISGSPLRIGLRRIQPSRSAIFNNRRIFSSSRLTAATLPLFLCLSGFCESFGPKCPNIGVNTASEPPFAKVFFKRIYSRDRRRKAADTGNLAPIHIFGRLEVLQRGPIGFDRVQGSEQEKARLGEHSLALCCSGLRRPLVSAAATSFSTARHRVAGFL